MAHNEERPTMKDFMMLTAGILFLLIDVTIVGGWVVSFIAFSNMGIF